jgi:TrmH family RNA methyltransferase
VRRLRRLVQKRTLRWSEGACVLEGPDLVSAALDGGVEFEALYVDVDAVDSPPVAALVERATDTGVRVFTLAPGVLEKVAQATTPQPLLAAVRFSVTPVTSLETPGLTLVLHDVRDPGNAGTIVRSADAAGASAVVFTGQSVDPYNPKTLRATAGSVFHLPVAVASLEETIAHFEARGAATYATVVRGGISPRDANLSGACVVVVGNEASGLSRADAERCQVAISIPMVGRSESLNAGVAASLVAYEALRQRQDRERTSPPNSLEET